MNEDGTFPRRVGGDGQQIVLMNNVRHSCFVGSNFVEIGRGSKAS